MTPLQARTPIPLPLPTDSLSGVDSLFAADGGVPAHAVPAADSLLVAADSAGAAAVQALSGDDYTLWYRKIAAETSGGAERLPLPTSSVHYRTAGAAEVFGPLSRAVPPHMPEVGTQHLLTDNAGFQALVLLLAAAYVVLLSRRAQEVGVLPGPLARNRASAERLVDDSPVNNIGRLRRFASLLGLLFVGMAAVRCVDLLLPETLTASLSDILTDILPGPLSGSLPALPGVLASLAGLALWGGATLVMALVGSYQAAVLLLAGALTLTRPFVGQLQELRQRVFSAMLLVLAPPLLFFAVAPPGTERFWGLVVAALSVITAAVYLMGSLRLFLAKKISILYWFLYLCAVEIFPLSLLWLLAGRGLW